MRYLVNFLILTWTPIISGQVFIGEVYLEDTYNYTKIELKGDTIWISLPFLDGSERFATTGHKSLNGSWEISRKNEQWKFRTELLDHKLIGNLKNNGILQPLTFYEYREGLAIQNKEFIGNYKDKNNRRVIIYERYGYLHLMSPYSKETVSLKTITKDSFWSASGERSQFKDKKGGRYQLLTITDRFRNEHQLTRLPDVKVGSRWIVINKDTLFAQVHLPLEMKKKMPACLLLPGGGAVEMDNYLYETRFLAAHGIVALIFDKAGNGKSKGESHFSRQTFEEKNEQYKAVFRFLRNQPFVDKDKIGIHGPSEGGRLALMMSIDLKDSVAFVNAVAAPLVDKLDGQLYAIKKHHGKLGVDERTILKIQQVWFEYFSGIVQGKINQSVLDQLTGLPMDERFFLPPNSTIIPVSPRKEDLLNDRVLHEAQRISCPVLLQYGEEDDRVDPIKNPHLLLQSGKSENEIDLIVYKRGNHSLMTPEYKICKGYMYDKVQWLRGIGFFN